MYNSDQGHKYTRCIAVVYSIQYKSYGIYCTVHSIQNCIPYNYVVCLYARLQSARCMMLHLSNHENMDQCSRITSRNVDECTLFKSHMSRATMQIARCLGNLWNKCKDLVYSGLVWFTNLNQCTLLFYSRGASHSRDFQARYQFVKVNG